MNIFGDCSLPENCYWKLGQRGDNHTLGKLKSRDIFQHSVGISALLVLRSVQERILKVSVLRNGSIKSA